MAIAFRAAGTVQLGDGAASLTLPAPAGTVATDVVLAVFVAAAGSSVQAIAGWTQAAVVDDGSAAPHLEVFWALGSASFGAWSVTTSSAIIGFTVGYSGVDNTTPMDATAVGQANATASTTATAPSITTVTANAMLVGFFGSYDGLDGTVPSWSGEFGPQRQSGGNRGGIDTVAGDSADAAQAIAGASGSKTATISKSLSNSGILVALRPTGGGGVVLVAGPTLPPDPLPGIQIQRFRRGVFGAFLPTPDPQSGPVIPPIPRLIKFNRQGVVNGLPLPFQSIRPRSSPAPQAFIFPVQNVPGIPPQPKVMKLIQFRAGPRLMQAVPATAVPVVLVVGNQPMLTMLGVGS